MKFGEVYRRPNDGLTIMFIGTAERDFTPGESLAVTAGDYLGFTLAGGLSLTPSYYPLHTTCYVTPTYMDDAEVVE